MSIRGREDVTGNILMSANFRRYAVTYTNDPTIVHNWLVEMGNWDRYGEPIVSPFPGRRRWRSRPHFGISLQWNHGTHAAATLQLACGPRVLIFHLTSAMYIPSSLVWFLCHPGIDYFSFLPPHVIRGFLAAAGIPMSSPLYNWYDMQPPQRRQMGIRRLLSVTVGFHNRDYCLENRPNFNWFNPVFSPQQITLASLLPFAASEMVFLP